MTKSEISNPYLGTVSHELRTPLNGMIGMTDFLLDTALDTLDKAFARD